MFKKTGERNEFMILTDENKNRITAEFLEQINYNGCEYAVMLESGADEVLIFAYSENGGEEFFSDVSDGEIDAVFEIFKENNSEEFDFDD